IGAAALASRSRSSGSRSGQHHRRWNGDAALALVPADDVDCEAGTVTAGDDSEATLHSQGKARYVDTDLLEDDGG
ncbi:MAG TPA: hypothetical protein VFO79_11065, partial [Xanthomonadales bacterium]|nr:hypothetical protein [Xanthomonadales bacterium]